MKQKVLIVEDNISLSQRQKDWLEQAGYDVMTAMREPAARALIRKHRFDFILSDVRLPEGDGISLLEWLTKEKKDIPFIVTTEYGSIPDAVRAIKLGAKDYLPKPVHREHLLELAEEIFRPLATVRTKPKDLFRCTCPKILEVERYARIVAPSDMSVLILGANGTGKESVAQGIHANSGRDGKFVAVNCGALPRELAASLLFGHEKGAFTGADTKREGYWEEADGGTLFLDEIGNLPPEVQQMMLRALESRGYRPVGGNKDRIADVRIIAATNEDLLTAIAEKRFRQDLFHRIKEYSLNIPPLRECHEDIIPLANFFLNMANREFGKHVKGFDAETRKRMLAHSWGGNVRELRGVVRSAVLFTDGEVITADKLEFEEPLLPANATLSLKNEETEKKQILCALEQAEGNRSLAAQLLGIGRTTLYNKLKTYGIE